MPQVEPSELVTPFRPPLIPNRPSNGGDAECSGESCSDETFTASQACAGTSGQEHTLIRRRCGNILERSVPGPRTVRAPAPRSHPGGAYGRSAAVYYITAAVS